MRVSRIYRLLRLITMLQQGQGYTAGDLARELEVSRRTIFRDLNVLEMAHIPYYFDSESGGYRINRYFFLPPVNLTLTEALAVILMTGRVRGAKRLPLLSHGTSAAVKLQSALPGPIREHIGSVIDRLSVSLGPLARHEGLETLCDDLTMAIARRRICRLTYISFHERRQIVTNVHPLRLIFIARAWYLLAYSAQHRQIRTFKVARIRKLAATNRQFRTPKDVDVENYFGDAWSMIPEGKLYDVHLRFSPMVAGNVAEVQWHHSQSIEWNDDGSAEFRVRVDGLGEMTWWILGYGEQVEVISPAVLRGRIVNTAKKVLSTHRKGER